MPRRTRSLKAFPMRVTGSSMQPLLPDGALVVATPVTSSTVLRVGDVIAARRPDRPDIELVKRISVISGSDTYFLLGDNPSQSTDSRHFGPVTREHIIARLRWRYWPLPPRRLSQAVGFLGPP